jgi:hypothetical protein
MLLRTSTLYGTTLELVSRDDGSPIQEDQLDQL